jgi:hypothetical protein
MPDYTRGTGAGGIMLIRDMGWQVQFHIQAGQSATFVGSPGFGTNAFVNGGWRGLPNLANYNNRQWRHLGSHDATYNQDVCFHIDSSGTQGFGGPTDFWQYIGRATVPGRPYPVGVDMIGHNSMRYIFSGTTDGGSPIREWQIGYSNDPNNIQYYMGSSGTTYFEGLAQGTWYFWSRGRNDVGWSDWSDRAQGTTLSSGRVKVNGEWRQALYYVKVAGQWRECIWYTKVNGNWYPVTGS